MKKAEFLAVLYEKTVFLPQYEREKLIEYYTEMIDEAMEEGYSEEDAVARLGTWDEIMEQVSANRTKTTPPAPEIIPPTEAGIGQKKTRRKNNLPVWAVLLLILTSPIWASIMFGILIVLFVLVIVGVALLITLFAVVASLAIVGVVSIPASLIVLFTGNSISFAVILGAALVCIGLAILCEILFSFCAGLFGTLIRVLFSGFGRIFH